MSIPRIKHGQEITSKLLNDIINIINALEVELKKTEEWNNNVDDTISEFRNSLQSLTERYDEAINSIPNLQELITTFAEAKRSGVIWTEGNIDNINNLIHDLAQIEAISADDEEVREALNNYLSGLTSEQDKLQIFRGSHTEILQRPIINKQILFDREHGDIYVDEVLFDGTKRRISYGGGNTGTAFSAPDISIILDDQTGEYVWKVVNGSSTIIYNGMNGNPMIPVRGVQGTPGLRGDEGPRGIKGDTGPRGPIGIQGPKGEDGATTLIDIKFSDYSTGVNATSEYIDQKYMGIKVYTDKMQPDEIASQPTQWIYIKGKTFYPHVDSQGNLTWSEAFNPDVYGEGINIKGPKGDKGDTGNPAWIAFSSDSNPTPIEPSTVIEGPDGRLTYVFDPILFKGDKGEQGLPGPAGEAGPKGDTPTIGVRVQESLTGEPSVVRRENISVNGTSFDIVFDFYIPAGPTGPAGIHVTNAFIEQGVLKIRLSDDTLIDTGTNLIGPKGDPGLQANMGEVSLEVLEPGVSPYGTFELINAVTNTYRLKVGIPKGLPGEAGPKGDTGATPTFISAAPITLAPGSDAGVTLENLGNNQYKLVFSIPRGDKGAKGDKGEPGDPGPEGPAGKSVNILGSLAAHTDLPSSGQNQNDSYLINGYLWVYTGASNIGTPPTEGSVYNGFVNVGLIQGPKGDTGATGADGVDGKNIELQSDATTGYLQWRNVGDTAWTNLVALSVLKGDKGDPGDTGAQGDPGTDGREIQLRTNTTHIQWRYVGDLNWTDLVALSAITGADGINGLDGKEVELRLEEGYIQWRHTGGSWTNLVDTEDLVGAPGEPGADGKTIHTGTTTPDNALGVDGDIFIHLTAYNLYLKVSGAWVDKGTLKGADGNDGINGTDGINGLDGKDGATWYKGTKVPTTSDPLGNKKGDFYLRITDTLADLYYRDAADWTYVNSLKGPAGANGTDGTRGSKIYTNTGEMPGDADGAPTQGLLAGDLYISLSDGSLWTRGSSAWAKVQNFSLKGQDGAAGNKWYSGAGAPTGVGGISGDFYLDTTAQDIYKHNGTSWDVVTNIKGSDAVATNNTFYGTLIGQYSSGQTYTISDNVPTIREKISTFINIHGKEAKVGDIYINTTKGTLYYCTAVSLSLCHFTQAKGIGKNIHYVTAESMSDAVNDSGASFKLKSTFTTDDYKVGDYLVDVANHKTYMIATVYSRANMYAKRVDSFLDGLQQDFQTLLGYFDNYYTKLQVDSLIADIYDVINNHHNSTNTPSDPPPDSGTGGGCLAIDTLIVMADLSVKRIDELKAGDLVRGYHINGMIDENQYNWRDFTTESTEGSYHIAKVKFAKKDYYSSYYVVNNDIKITIKHAMFVKNKDTGIWGWYDVDRIRVGDSLFGHDGKEVKIDSILYKKERLDVVMLDVEEVDTYFAGNSKVLVHNTLSVIKPY